MSASSDQEVRRTVLYEAHRAAGAAFVNFHGWEMPLRYTSIPEEHLKVRLSAGMFDLCHMGRLEVTGPGALEWADSLVTNDIEGLATGRARYALFLNESGGVLDDAIVYRLPQSILAVVNAANRERIIQWMEEHRPQAEARLVDRTFEWAMVAVQGPQTARFVPDLFTHPSKPFEELRYYEILSATYAGHPVWVSRTGYTGEDGFEVFLPAGDALRFWNETLERGGNRVAPAGLGARDTLRLEAGMPLYGNELDTTTNPFEAGLEFAVKLEKKNPFPGKEALLRIRKEGIRRKLCGFRVDGRRVARKGMSILSGERVVGTITSGAPSPTLGCPIAMGYLECEVERAVRAGKEELFVDLRGRRERLILESLPFYSRTRKKKPSP